MITRRDLAAAAARERRRRAPRRCRGSPCSRNGGRGALTLSSRAAANRTTRWCSSTACASTHLAAASTSRSCRSATSSGRGGARPAERALTAATPSAASSDHDAAAAARRRGSACSSKAAAQACARRSRRRRGDDAAMVVRAAAASTLQNDGFTGTAPQRRNRDERRLRTSHGGVERWAGAQGPTTRVRGTYRCSTPIAATPGLTGSNPTARFTGVDAVSRGFDTASQGGVRRSPVGSPAGRPPAAALRVTQSDLDNALPQQLR